MCKWCATALTRLVGDHREKTMEGLGLRESQGEEHEVYRPSLGVEIL